MASSKAANSNLARRSRRPDALFHTPKAPSAQSKSLSATKTPTDWYLRLSCGLSQRSTAGPKTQVLAASARSTLSGFTSVSLTNGASTLLRYSWSPQESFRLDSRLHDPTASEQSHRPYTGPRPTSRTIQDPTATDEQRDRRTEEKQKRIPQPRNCTKEGPFVHNSTQLYVLGHVL